MSYITKLIALWRASEIRFDGRHGWFAAFQSRGTVDWRTTVQDALEKTTYDPQEFISAFAIVLKQVQKEMARGYRVDIGEDFMTIWPNSKARVLDSIDPSTGQTIVATPDDLKKVEIETKGGCTFYKSFIQTLSAMIKWKKVTGTSVDNQETEIEDATQDPNLNFDDTSTGTQDTSTNNTPSGDDGLGG